MKLTCVDKKWIYVGVAYHVMDDTVIPYEHREDMNRCSISTNGHSTKNEMIDDVIDQLKDMRDVSF